MRIEGIDAEAAVALSAQVSYLSQRGLAHKVTASTLQDDTGTRLLRENNWRSVDLYEILKALDVSQNKYMVLRLLKRGDLLQMIRLLDKAKLINGLRFFSKEKLLKLMTMLPKRLLIKMLLHLMSIEKLVGRMPPHVLFSILKSDKLDNRALLKGFEKLPPQFLQFVMGKVTGQDMSHLRPSELKAMFMQIPKRQLIEGMKMLPFKALIPLVTTLVKQDPELLESVNKAFYLKIFDKMQKNTILDSFVIVSEDILWKFLAHLPDNLLVLTAAQLDDSMVEKYLVSEQSNLLYQLAG